MPWSMPLAEPLGSVAGFVAGEVVHRFAHRIAENLDLNETQVKFIGTAAAHFMVATVTKGVANIACGDPIGFGINPITSFATALAHGALRVGVDRLELIWEGDEIVMGTPPATIG
ncbi:MAG: hypothetical protein H6970_10650 [Gammaproteobacteria bacterium]|nr:hypothetical protein [Gammaproteobacteria bacterium]MCP5425511.1 hypothetical protein [Gammaproteobacteria bacterium]MCP5459369.1 hypothetical protein [Gammaproteobacteria bacterium]